MKVSAHLIFPGKKFPFYVRRSSYVHLGLLLLTLVGGKIVLIQQEKIRNANIELIQASVRVDMVAMPKYTLNELKNLSSGVEEAQKEEPNAAPAAEKPVEAAKEPEPDKVETKDVETADATAAFEEASKQKRQDFLSKLKQIGSKKINSEGNQKADKGLYGEKATDLKQLVLAGNRLNKGSAMYGEGTTADLTAFQAYKSRLPDRIRPRWKLPSFLADKKLKARVRVWLASNGEVTRAEIFQTSGDIDYDQRAVDAVKSASPFPRLEAEFEKSAQSGNIVLGFPL